MDGDRIKGLDGLRAVAVLLVFAFHAKIFAFTGGWIGVDVFFALSGFLITRNLVQEADRTGTISLRSFYWRRTLRLAPALMLLLIVVFALKPNLWKSEILPAAFYISNWTRAFSDFPRILGHTWSLAIEEQFYLLWPLGLLLLLRMRRENAAVIVVTLSLALCAWRAWLLMSGASTARLYNGFDTHADGILLGSALALSSRLWWQRLASLWPLAVAVLFFVAATLPWRQPLVYAGGLWFIALAATVVIAGVVSDNAGPFVRFLEWKPLARLGVISYGFYLWHYPILIFVREYGLPKLGVVAAAFAITLTAAIASWHLVETPALKLKGARHKTE